MPLKVCCEWYWSGPVAKTTGPYVPVKVRQHFAVSLLQGAGFFFVNVLPVLVVNVSIYFPPLPFNL